MIVIRMMTEGIMVMEIISGDTKKIFSIHEPTEVEEVMNLKHAYILNTFSKSLYSLPHTLQCSLVL